MDGIDVKRCSVTKDGEIVMSIEESNRIRAELGIKPLNIMNGKINKDNVYYRGNNDTNYCNDEVEWKNAREELTSGHGLGDIVDDEDDMDVLDWVKKMKKRDTEKAILAIQGAGTAANCNSTTLNGMSNEYISRENFNNTINPVLKVVHDIRDFKEGEEAILTLRDKNILDEHGELADINGEDIQELEDLEKTAKEKLEKKLLDKKRKHTYNPVEDLENIGDKSAGDSEKCIVEYVYNKQFIPEKPKSILPQYDETLGLNMKKQEGFILGLTLEEINSANPEMKLEILEKRQQENYIDKQGINSAQKIFEKYLNGNNNCIPNGGEEVKIKRKKKNTASLRKVMKDGNVGDTKDRAAFWDDFFSTTDRAATVSPDADHRSKRFQLVEQDNGRKASIVDQDNSMKNLDLTRNVKTEETSSSYAGNVDSSVHMPYSKENIIVKKEQPVEKNSLVNAEEDEFDKLLYEQLAKQRRLVQKCKYENSEHKADLYVVNHLKSESAEGVVLDSKLIKSDLKDVKAEINDALQLTCTTEFCRSILTPLEKLEVLKNEIGNTANFYGHPSEKEAEKKNKKSGDKDDGKNTMESDTGAKIKEDTDSDYEDPLQENPLDGGLVSALNFFKSKQDLNLDVCRIGRINKDNAPLHMSTEKGDIKIDYKDKYGRVMNPKEAFRHISWVFHGKGPGKKKLEKHLKMLEMEKRIRENPMEALPTIRALHKAQKDEQKPYLILTGGKINT